MYLGEHLLTKTGTITIISKEIIQQSQPVYNLEIRQWHNFLVGSKGVVAHNSYFLDYFLKSIGVNANSIIMWKDNSGKEAKWVSVISKNTPSTKELIQSESFGEHLAEELLVFGKDKNNEDFRAIDAIAKNTGKMISFKEIQNKNENTFNDRIKEAFEKVGKYNEKPVYEDIPTMILMPTLKTYEQFISLCVSLLKTEI